MTTSATPITITRPIIAHLTVDNAAAAMDFYQKAFGAVDLGRHLADDGKRIMHASMSIGGHMFMLNDDFPEMTGGKPRHAKAMGGSPVTLHLTCPQVDALWAQALAAGATVEFPLADQFWGDRYGIVRDPFGHSWSMGCGTHKEKDAK